jgi:hypothetical protein
VKTSSVRCAAASPIRTRNRHDDTTGMSRLDTFIIRLEAQRFLLNHCCEELAGAYPDGSLALELGLGNGRTYHHLREHLPHWRVVAFERRLVAHPKSMPAAGDLIMGDLADTAREAAERFGRTAAFAHADLGNGIEADDLVLAAWLAPAVAALVRDGGLILTSTALTHPALEVLPLPAGTPPYDYFLYRRR